MSKKLRQIKQLNEMFADFKSELIEYDLFKDIDVAPDVLKQEKILVREIRALFEMDFVKDAGNTDE